MNKIHKNIIQRLKARDANGNNTLRVCLSQSERLIRLREPAGPGEWLPSRWK